MKYDTHPGFDKSPIEIKLWEIRHQLEINEQIIKRGYPDSLPDILPHAIEIVTAHVHDRLDELENMIKELKNA